MRDRKEEEQQFLARLESRNPEEYPCLPAPGTVFDERGKRTGVVTAARQIRIKTEGDWEVWSPILYQSCMNPKELRIYCLTAEDLGDGRVRLKTRYKEKIINPQETETEISPWIPQIHKSDCLHCTNCGKCSW